jgi:hypothetical protein
MLIPVELSESLLADANSASKITKRNLAEQIEHWARLGKSIEENPELPVLLIQDILASQADIALNKLSKFRFG